MMTIIDALRSHRGSHTGNVFKKNDNACDWLATPKKAPLPAISRGWPQQVWAEVCSPKARLRQKKSARLLRGNLHDSRCTAAVVENWDRTTARVR
jgi:hypothetical protein